jgi:hypothetical protein
MSQSIVPTSRTIDRRIGALNSASNCESVSCFVACQAIGLSWWYEGAIPFKDDRLGSSGTGVFAKSQKAASAAWAIPSSSQLTANLRMMRMYVSMNPHFPKTGRGIRGRAATGRRPAMLRIVSCILVVTGVGIGPARAQSNFEALAGVWSGGGMMKPADGPRERVKCKINYIPKKEGQSLKMEVRCASDAYKMNLSANIDQEGSAISGDWFESEYRQGGKVSGQSSDGLIEAKVESQTVVASLTVRTKGDRQSFEMEAPGLWVSEVQIDLVRDAH